MNDSVLDQCLAALDAGESVDACLARYPEYAQELAPILEAATRLHGARDITAPAAFKADARQRLLERINEAPIAERAQPGRWQRLWRDLAMVWSRPLATPVWARAALILVVVFAGLLATTFAAQAALPGSSLYAVKLLSEEAVLSVVADPADLQLHYAERRLDEAAILMARGRPEFASESMRGYKRMMAAWEDTVNTVGISDPGRVQRQLAGQVQRLGRLVEAAPERYQTQFRREEAFAQRRMARFGSGPPSTPTPALPPTSSPAPTLAARSPTPSATPPMASGPRHRTPLPRPSHTPERQRRMTPPPTATPSSADHDPSTMPGDALPPVSPPSTVHPGHGPHPGGPDPEATPSPGPRRGDHSQTQEPPLPSPTESTVATTPTPRQGGRHGRQTPPAPTATPAPSATAPPTATAAQPTSEPTSEPSPHTPHPMHTPVGDGGPPHPPPSGGGGPGGQH